MLSQLVLMTFGFTVGAIAGYATLKHPILGNRFSAIITGFFLGIIVYVITMAASGW